MVDFHLFYDGAVDIQKWALLTRSQCKVSDTQVTVKAHGPLVYYLDHALCLCCIGFFLSVYNDTNWGPLYHNRVILAVGQLGFHPAATTRLELGSRRDMWVILFNDIT